MFRTPFQGLKRGLEKTRTTLFGRVRELVTRKVTFDAETLDEIEAILIASDMGVEAAGEITERLRRTLRGERFSPNELESVERGIRDALVDILGGPGTSAADRLRGSIFAHSLIKPLYPVGDEIETGDLLLQAVDALQISVDDFQRLLEIAKARAAPAARARTRDHEIGGRHHHIERGGGDQGRDLRDAGMGNEAHREGERSDRHGNQDDHVEHAEPSRGAAPPRGQGNGVRHVHPPSQKSCGDRPL